MQKIVLLLISIFLFALSGCATKMTNYQQTIDGNAMDFSKADTMKMGKACLGTNIFGMYVGGDNNSVAAAAENGGISVVKHVEKEFILSALPKNCTIVYGE